RIARAAMAADRLSLRQTGSLSHYGRDMAWQRRIRISLALEEASRWSPLIERVQGVLGFLTDDDWELTCAELIEGEALQTPLVASPFVRDTEVALFSGGLDSSAGAWSRGRHGVRHLTAVSAYGTAVRRRAQGEAVTCLKKLGVPISWVGVA